MDTAAVSSLQHQVLTWDYFEMYDAEQQSDAVRETLKRPPNTFSSPEASCRVRARCTAVCLGLRFPESQQSQRIAAKQDGSASSASTMVLILYGARGSQVSESS